MKSAPVRSFACSITLLALLGLGCRTPQAEPNPVTPLPVVITPAPVPTNSVIPMPDVVFGRQ